MLEVVKKLEFCGGIQKTIMHLFKKKICNSLRISIR